MTYAGTHQICTLRTLRNLLHTLQLNPNYFNRKGRKDYAKDARYHCMPFSAYCGSPSIMLEYHLVISPPLQKTAMKAIAAFVSGLLLSAVLLLPTALRAAELEPFLTVKVSNINTLISVAERVATLADAANEPDFREVIRVVRDIRGFNFDGDFGFAAVIADDGSLNPMLVLPITDLWRVEFPESPEIFDSIRPFLARRSAERTDINSPMGTYAALQKEGYLVIVPADIADLVPADARTLFADLARYTYGMKLDLEKVEFETLEANLFGPILFMAMMQSPDMGEQLENMIELYRELYKELAMLSYGVAFNPQTADVELAYAFAWREGSDMAKMFTDYKREPTVFGGFRGTPANTVFSFGDSASWEKFDLKNSSMWALSMEQYEVLFEGIIEQIEMEDETGEAGKIARDVLDTVTNLYIAEVNRGASDSALSFNTDGTLLVAFDTVSLAEIQKLAELAVSFLLQRASFIAGLAEVNLAYTSIEGFTVSNVKVPIVETMEAFLGPAPGEVPASVRALTLNGFWAVKGGNQQAVAVAAGIDFDKAEQAFKTALEQTRTPAAVQKPIGVFSVQGLGRFLQQMVQPIVEKGFEDQPDEHGERHFESVKSVFAVLAAAGNDAAITMDTDITANQIDFGLRVSGRAIQAVIAAFKIAADAANPFVRPGIRNF